MFEAINVLCEKTFENEHRRRVAILGDMNELGHVAKVRHREVGEFAANANVDLLIAIGEHSRNTHEGFLSKNSNGNAKYFQTLDEFQEVSKEILNANDLILVKASRGMFFEKIIETLSATPEKT
jgi:UDP-N-acetylmuramoyl-tripeptide--D-alanyl-D-alanine ligase